MKVLGTRTARAGGKGRLGKSGNSKRSEEGEGQSCPGSCQINFETNLI